MVPNKRARVEEPLEIESDHSEFEDSDECITNEVITATFEGRNLEDFDFHGIKQLLLQLFVKAPIDVSQITDILINQHGIGSVLKQAPENEDDEEDEDDMNNVYGVSTVLNLSACRETPAVGQLIEYFKEQAKKHADEKSLKKFNSILNDNKNLGLLINERFANIPAKISAPMLSSLQDEIKRMKKKHPEYGFHNFIILCKINKYEKKKAESSFVNDEEMIFSVHAEYSFEYDVTKDSAAAVGGEWGEEEKDFLRFRKVLLVPADKLPDIIKQINTFVQT